MISHPVFHDFVKSLLHREDKQIFNLCSTIPELNSSNLFKKDAWLFSKADQEVLLRVANRPWGKADAIWYFKRNGNVYPPNQTLMVIHEVKTGAYNLEDVVWKYNAWQNSFIWIWGWEIHHIKNKPETLKLKQKVRQPELSILQPLYIAYLDWFMVGLNVRGEVM